jgi:hypothetical protein
MTSIFQQTLFKQKIRGMLQRAIAVGVPPAPGLPIPVGPVIPNNMIRRITRVIIFNAGIPQMVEFTLAQGVPPVPLPAFRILQDFWCGPGLPQNSFGNGSPNTPLFVCRPSTSIAPVPDNLIYAQGQIPAGPAVTVEIEYWDSRW